MREWTKQAIEEHKMLKPGGRVIAALSGGADSVCLLALLSELKEELGFALRAVHVHHGLRGQEADRDADFSATICEKLSVPCHIIRVNVRAFAREQGLTEEEAGRRLRYEALEREAASWEEEDRKSGREGKDPVRIAVAHHRGDQAETILHNLFRGSGLNGLGGMPRVRGRIIRPLLDADREDIVFWLREKGISWMEDSTNASGDYTRNRIRNRVLPMIEREINPKAQEHLLRLGALAGKADQYLRERAVRWIRRYGRPLEDGGFFLGDAAFGDEEEIIWLYGILEILKNTAGGGRDLGFIHVEQVLDLRKKQVGRRLRLGRGLCVKREYGGLSVYRENFPKKEEKWELPPVETEVFSYKKGEEIPKNVYTKWFDCDKIKDTPTVRTRRQGDYLILEDGSRKSIRRLMIDEKIPREDRDRIPLLADGSHVMWVIGFRMSGYYKIGPSTRRIMEVRGKGQDGKGARGEDTRGKDALPG